ncbi:MAG: type II toxin-antitoxin system HicA family toxin [Caulobacterales bacterium]|nr:type II toxin-antitoxin system HicA family toxin [Caulobacterales bacterium]
MPHDYYPELVQLLRAAGWRRISGGKGSHEKWRHPGSVKTLVVPRTKSRHTANDILKDAGLPKSF